MRCAACRSADTSESISSTHLKGLVSGGVSAFTVEGWNGRQEGTVPIKLADLLREDSIALDAAPCGYGCDRGTRVAVESAAQRGARTRLVFRLLGGAVGKKRRGGVRKSSAATVVGGRSTGTDPPYSHSSRTLQAWGYASSSFYQCGPRACERAPPEMRLLEIVLQINRSCEVPEA